MTPDQITAAGGAIAFIITALSTTIFRAVGKANRTIRRQRRLLTSFADYTVRIREAADANGIDVHRGALRLPKLLRRYYDTENDDEDEEDGSDAS